MLPELGKCNEAHLTLRLFFVMLLIHHLQIFITPKILPTFRLRAFLEALGPSTEVAILKESVMKL